VSRVNSFCLEYFPVSRCENSNEAGRYHKRRGLFFEQHSDCELSKNGVVFLDQLRDCEICKKVLVLVLVKFQEYILR
jgi:hypothetical protein